MRCLITGSLGQDGYYLGKLLQEQGHEVFGMVYRKGDHSVPFGTLVRGDLTDSVSINRLVEDIRPDEIYNLGGFSHSGQSYGTPEKVLSINGMGAVRIYEAARRYVPNARIFQASSSEIFGDAQAPQSEDTRVSPINPYGAAKAYAHHMGEVYRTQGLWVSCGILFNHASMHSGLEHLPHKFLNYAFEISKGRATTFRVGSLHTKRDIGWAGDYVKAMVMMLRHNLPINLVIGTGNSVSMKELGEEIFQSFGLKFSDHIEVDPALYRPSEISHTEADITRAMKTIGWIPWISDTAMLVDMLVGERAAA
ncbi:GDP-mannose 4,6-dehydratase [Candidatus Pacearchaeota archaeon]|nr:GDP-mannose 4,6-dehydratase [Candidatus Pacearchaeota archaeon]|tara:strand:+ start:3819 stop:4742 length:924 start_codon:yes stop_codon:yes gene_type:complete